MPASEILQAYQRDIIADCIVPRSGVELDRPVSGELTFEAAAQILRAVVEYLDSYSEENARALPIRRSAYKDIEFAAFRADRLATRKEWSNSLHDKFDAALVGAYETLEDGK
ncbi:hypothetical protein ACIGXM_13970 [Kitasatospora sp. NPDC052896]|uniref:hypothetical protein n=1 Tax=Kitasatospora sp. NPDC052896 TaxID=3364061 RepID=UPI0037CC8204